MGDILAKNVCISRALPIPTMAAKVLHRPSYFIEEGREEGTGYSDNAPKPCTYIME